MNATPRDVPWGFDPAADTYTAYVRWAKWLNEKAHEVEPHFNEGLFDSLTDEQAVILYRIMIELVLGDDFVAAIERRAAATRAAGGVGR